jgi:hypothetical protein
MRGSKEINAVMPWVVATLQNLPSSFEGSVKEVSAYYPDDLLSMYVVREPHTKGPLFQAIGIGGAPPANLDALARKRSKVYQTDRPLHLLAWLGSRQVLQDPDGERLLREIEEILCHSKFACIWIFERGRNGVARYERH